MGDEPILVIPQTFKEKLLFHITAFFVLLAIFSLFAFLFLVPFVIEPAFTTIFMEFDENPAECVTAEVVHFKGASNCSWTSCKEGCTREVYECTQIRVNYKVFDIEYENDTVTDDEIAVIELDAVAAGPPSPSSSEQTRTQSQSPSDNSNQHRVERAIREYNYIDSYDHLHRESHKSADLEFMEYPEVHEVPGATDNMSEWFFTGAKLFPNVKGCGYPPKLNCSIWLKQFIAIGSNFSCYYSRVDPGLVISDLDLRQNMLNLIYAMAIPIPSFIVSVIYLTFAYFKIYNEDEEAAPLDQNAEDIADEDEVAATENVDVIVPNGTATISVASVPVTPTSNDMASFGHQLKVQMADEMSRESLDGGFISYSVSIQG